MTSIEKIVVGIAIAASLFMSFASFGKPTSYVGGNFNSVVVDFAQGISVAGTQVITSARNIAAVAGTFSSSLTTAGTMTVAGSGTSTLVVGGTSTTKGSCLKLYSASGTLVYFTVSAATNNLATSTSVACN